MQSRPSIAEFDNLAKKCEFLTEKNLELRSQVSLLQSEVELLRDDQTVSEMKCSCFSRLTRKWSAGSNLSRSGIVTLPGKLFLTPQAVHGLLVRN